MKAFAEPMTAMEVATVVGITTGCIMLVYAVLVITLLAYWAWKESHDTKLEKPTEMHIH